MKQCSRCKKNKNFDQFYKNSNSLTGYSGYCKECTNEYARDRRGSKKRYSKTSFIDETSKECTSCKKIKTFDEFAKNSSSKSGLHSWCKECVTNKSLSYRGGRVYKKLKRTKTHKECRFCGQMNIILGSKKSYCDNCISEKGYASNIKLRFHMSLDDYNNMVAKQGGVCAICKTNPKNKRLSIDHNHNCCPGQYTCGKCIRSLICHRCNMVLGQINDDISILKAMTQYLQNF